jgi:hypothetical protein
MTRVSDWPVVAGIGSLLIALLVCICLLAFPSNNNNKTNQVALEVAQQQNKIELAELDRKYEIRINRLQEQLNSLEFVTSKRTELMEEDIRKLRRENEELQQRIKPQH